MAQIVQWGDYVKLDITQNQIDTIIKQYVNKHYPSKVKQYQIELQRQQQKKLEKYSDVLFVNGNLMWEDQKSTQEKQFNILESKIYCRKLKLGKKYDWRVPTYDELRTLVDYDKNTPSSIDKISYINSTKYWTISKNIDEQKRYWYINFKDGSSNFEFKDNRNNIRCVRDRYRQKDKFIKKINIVIDKTRAIMWQDNSESIEHIEDITMAKVYCEDLILNGYTDWRLANIKQLQSIIDIEQKKSTIKKEFKYIKNGKYWTSSKDISTKENYWFVDFKNGIINSTNKNKNYLVRCLRDIK